MEGGYHNVTLSEKYKPLFRVMDTKDIRYVLLEGGRGSGKSFVLSCFLNHMSFVKNNKILFTRYTMVSAETSIIPEFRGMCETLGNDDSFIFKKTEVNNVNSGCNIIYRGLKPSSNTANSALKSVNNVNILVLEEAQECADEALFDRVDFSIRTKGIKNIVLLVLNPTDKTHWIYKRFHLKKRKDTLYLKTTYLDNIDNLDSSFLSRAEEIKAINSRKYNNIFMGDYLDDIAGALWNYPMLEQARKLDKIADYQRIVVAIDPAVSSNKNSSETGIVVAALMSNGRYMVIEDQSGVYSPTDWGNVAINLYHKNNADCIIGEINNGGDLIEQNIRNLEPNVNFKQVRATRGKILRAEPISALYEQGKVSHLQRFPELEEQMTSYTGAQGEESPDRLDALVWALTELSSNPTQEMEIIMV